MRIEPEPVALLDDRRRRSQGGDGAALIEPEYDGYVTLTAGAEKLSVPWHVLPRRAAKMVAGAYPNLRGVENMTFANTGAKVGDYDLLSLVGSSGSCHRLRCRDLATTSP